MSYVKLFSSILDSTIWQECPETRIVWITMLAMSDSVGMVRATTPGISQRARVSLKATKTALETLSGPDPDSKIREHEGRRIERTDEGWQILNYMRYRLTKDLDYERHAARERKRKQRQIGKDVTPRHGRSRPVTDVRQAEEEKEVEAEEEKNPPTPLIPPVLLTPEFNEAWQRWEQHRREIRHTLTTSTKGRQLATLARLGATEAVIRINHSIEQGYQGLYSPKGPTSEPRRGWDNLPPKESDGSG